jgi:LuxR family maltose regulon positive regulatory protein
LFIPRARTNLVSRPRLLAQLDQAQDHPLTLISAPPGFGKTTLLRDWIPRHPHCLTWLALDAGDNDPARFWSYFIASLQTLNERLGLEALTLLQSSPAPAWEVIVSLLLNDLAAFPDRFACVLDDYHVVDNRAIHDAVTFLIEHQPDNMRLILTSRSDPPLPLARWRARAQLAEIRAHDLRFAPDEAAAFLREVSGVDTVGRRGGRAGRSHRRLDRGTAARRAVNARPGRYRRLHPRVHRQPRLHR